MEPPERRPVVRSYDADTTAFEATPGPATARRASAVAAPVPPKLAAMLLPGERLTFGSSPHPVVFVQPVAVALAIGAVLVALLHQPWLAHGAPRVAALVVGIAALATQVVVLVQRAGAFAGLRVVATNRRVFAVRGVLVRRVTPLGNTALAGSTLAQSIFGRIFGYGTIRLPLADGTPDAFRDMRDPVELYREFQAVANGVDGDVWTPAARRTIIP
jgi:hypothetical protein